MLVRTPLNIVYSSFHVLVRLGPGPPAPVGVAVPVRYASPSLGARRTSRRIEPTSGAVGVERHYSIWKGLYGPYAALARNLSSAGLRSYVLAQGR
jgi:hypothetical protein